MEKKELSLSHLLKPAQSQHSQPPALFMLHGYGSDEADLAAFAPDLPGELCIISVRAPYPLPYGYAWYSIYFGGEKEKWSDDDEARRSREKIANFIDEACRAYSLDAERVSLLGFSQGCALSFAVALSYPKKVKNVIALSGYLPENLLAEDYGQNDFSDLHIYQSHGSLDQVIPVEWARQAAPLLKKLRVDYTYQEFPVGHGISPPNFYAFRKWLEGRLEHTRS